MKKFFIRACLIVILLAMPFMLSFSFKNEACKSACKEAYKKCQKEAGDDTVLKATCETGYEECLKKCENQD